jgi:mRNA interferase MazF
MSIKVGDIVLVDFPHTDFTGQKQRPVIVLASAPVYDDWLVSMISSKKRKDDTDFEEEIKMDDDDFINSGLLIECCIRIQRLAVISESMFKKKLGTISQERLYRVKKRLTDWINKNE